MSDELVPVQVVGVGRDPFGNDFVLLRDHRDRSLPIWIGECEAVAIHLKLEGRDMPRPMTHDLLLNIIRRLNAEVLHLTIDDLWQSTFYAKLVLQVGEEKIEIDCRPSDGIAIALRANAPIYVVDDVMEEGKWTGETREESGEESDEESEE